jgi:hypothetical protein
MSDKLGKLLKNIKGMEPPVDLKVKIFNAIQSEREKAIKKKLVLSYVGIFASVAAFVYSIIIFGNVILQSEFWSLLTLATTDAQLVLSDLSAYLLSLLETFPVMSAVIILIPIFTLLLSFVSYFKVSEKNQFHCYHFV